MSRGPEFPEIRDEMIKNMGLEEKAKAGLDTLTTREVGTIGGQTNKMMVDLAKQALERNTLQYK